MRAFSLYQSWKYYILLIERHPLRMHSLNTCVLMGSGDVIAQVALEKCRCVRDYDFHRSLRFFGVGLLLAGPGMCVWYSWLDKVAVSWRTSRNLVAVCKMAADQTLFLPVYLIVFVSVMGRLRGDDMNVITAKLRRDMKPMLLTSYSIWPAVQLINFRFVPLRHRILMINIVCLLWNTVIGWRAEQQLTERGESTTSLDTTTVTL